MTAARKYVILSKRGRLVGAAVFNTRIRAEQELTKASQRVAPVTVFGGVIRKPHA